MASSKRVPIAGFAASALMHNVRIGRRALVCNAILEKGVLVEDGARIGHDLDADRGRYTVSRCGVDVVGNNEIVRAT